MSMNILKPALLCLLLLPLQSLAAEAPYVPPAAVLAELNQHRRNEDGQILGVQAILEVGQRYLGGKAKRDLPSN